ncbi:hypothetical protein JOF48_000576 [Arthrobacter stackebrandtii]|uniref:Uncharacterized protein n=1 Tax=Arthrobacter stackebrandtii TaxID=272161 RepID=A0ABS4YTQ9_9MICC|nr:hypothetical protein [Arthrobacter stackebrandtii]MBP2411777.1 hypothetical protein [Arthrobacter stackebrandtii]
MSSSTGSGTVLIADFVNVDAAGKVNIIGGGIQFLGSDPETGLTAPFAVYVNVTVSIPLFDETSAAVEVVLVDTDGQPVVVPSPEGPNIMRFNQDVDFRHTVRPEVQPPPMGFPGTSNIVLNFPGGLPLPTGSSYEWVVLLDESRLCSTTFFVPGAE